MNKPTILAVEDDAAIRSLISTTLKTHDYNYLTARDGRSALLEASSHNPDIILLDLGLPDMDGVEIIKKIRSWSMMPIIVISARSEDRDKIEALDAGADDYVVKPFMPRELTARIRAVLRRASAEGRARESAVPPADDRQEEIVRCGPLLMNETRFEATADGMPLKLSVKEFRLLLMFASRPGRVFTRGQLLENIWGNSFVDERTVDVHMLRLRKALAGTPAENLIETVRGVGYRCRPLD